MMRSKSLLRYTQSVIENQLGNKTIGISSWKPISNEQLAGVIDHKFPTREKKFITKRETIVPENIGKNKSKSNNLLTTIKDSINKTLTNEKCRSFSCSRLSNITKKNFETKFYLHNTNSHNCIDILKNNKNTISEIINNLKKSKNASNNFIDNQPNFSYYLSNNQAKNYTDELHFKKCNLNRTNRISKHNNSKFNRTINYNSEVVEKELKSSHGHPIHFYQLPHTTCNKDFKTLTKNLPRNVFKDKVQEQSNNESYRYNKTSYYRQITNETEITLKNKTKKFNIKIKEKLSSVWRNKNELKIKKNQLKEMIHKYLRMTNLKCMQDIKYLNASKTRTADKNFTDQNIHLQIHKTHYYPKHKTNLDKKCLNNVSEPNLEYYETLKLNEIQNDKIKLIDQQKPSRNRTTYWKFDPTARYVLNNDFDLISRKLNHSPKIVSKNFTTTNNNSTNKFLEDVLDLKPNIKQDSLDDGKASNIIKLTQLLTEFDKTLCTEPEKQDEKLNSSHHRKILPQPSLTQNELNMTLKTNNDIYLNEQIENGKITNSTTEDGLSINKSDQSQNYSLQKTAEIEVKKLHKYNENSTPSCMCAKSTSTVSRKNDADIKSCSDFVRKGTKQEKVLMSIYNGKNILHENKLNINKKQDHLGDLNENDSEDIVQEHENKMNNTENENSEMSVKITQIHETSRRKESFNDTKENMQGVAWIRRAQKNTIQQTGQIDDELDCSGIQQVNSLSTSRKIQKGTLETTQQKSNHFPYTRNKDSHKLIKNKTDTENVTKRTKAAEWKLVKHSEQTTSGINYENEQITNGINYENNQEKYTLLDIDEKIFAITKLKGKQQEKIKATLDFRQTNESDRKKYNSNDTKERTRAVAWVREEHNCTTKQNAQVNYETDCCGSQENYNPINTSFPHEKKEITCTNLKKSDKPLRNSTTAIPWMRNKSYNKKSENNLFSHMQDKITVAHQKNKNYSKAAFESKDQESPSQNNIQLKKKITKSNNSRDIFDKWQQNICCNSDDRVEPIQSVNIDTNGDNLIKLTGKNYSEYDSNNTNEKLKFSNKVIRKNNIRNKQLHPVVIPWIRGQNISKVNANDERGLNKIKVCTWVKGQNIVSIASNECTESKKLQNATPTPWIRGENITVNENLNSENGMSKNVDEAIPWIKDQTMLHVTVNDYRKSESLKSAIPWSRGQSIVIISNDNSEELINLNTASPWVRDRNALNRNETHYAVFNITRTMPLEKNKYNNKNECETPKKLETKINEMENITHKQSSSDITIHKKTETSLHSEGTQIKCFNHKHPNEVQQTCRTCKETTIKLNHIDEQSIQTDDKEDDKEILNKNKITRNRTESALQSSTWKKNEKIKSDESVNKIKLFKGGVINEFCNRTEIATLPKSNTQLNDISSDKNNKKKKEKEIFSAVSMSRKSVELMIKTDGKCAGYTNISPSWVHVNKEINKSIPMSRKKPFTDKIQDLNKNEDKNLTEKCLSESRSGKLYPTNNAKTKCYPDFEIINMNHDNHSMTSDSNIRSKTLINPTNENIKGIIENGTKKDKEDLLHKPRSITPKQHSTQNNATIDKLIFVNENVKASVLKEISSTNQSILQQNIEQIKDQSPNKHNTSLSPQIANKTKVIPDSNVNVRNRSLNEEQENTVKADNKLRIEEEKLKLKKNQNNLLELKVASDKSNASQIISQLISQKTIQEIEQNSKTKDNHISQSNERINYNNQNQNEDNILNTKRVNENYLINKMEDKVTSKDIKKNLTEDLTDKKGIGNLKFPDNVINVKVETKNEKSGLVKLKEELEGIHNKIKSDSNFPTEYQRRNKNDREVNMNSNGKTNLINQHKSKITENQKELMIVNNSEDNNNINALEEFDTELRHEKTHSERMTEFYEFERKLLGFSCPIHSNRTCQIPESLDLTNKVNSILTSNILQPISPQISKIGMKNNIMNSSNDFYDKDIEKNTLNTTGSKNAHLQEVIKLQNSHSKIPDKKTSIDSETLKAFQSKNKGDAKKKHPNNLKQKIHTNFSNTISLKIDSTTDHKPQQGVNTSEKENISINETKDFNTAFVKENEAKYNNESQEKRLPMLTNHYSNNPQEQKKMTETIEENQGNKTMQNTPNKEFINNIIKIYVSNKEDETKWRLVNSKKTKPTNELKPSIPNHTDELIPKYPSKINKITTNSEYSNLKSAQQDETAEAEAHLNGLKDEHSNHNRSNNQEDMFSQTGNKIKKSHEIQVDKRAQETDWRKQVERVSEKRNSLLNINMLKEIFDSQMNELEFTEDETMKNKVKKTEEETDVRNKSNFISDCTDILKNEHVTICIPHKTLSSRTVLVTQDESMKKNIHKEITPILKTMLNAVIYTVLKNETTYNKLTRSHDDREKTTRIDDITQLTEQFKKKWQRTGNQSIAATNSYVNEVKSDWMKNPFIMPINGMRFPMINNRKSKLYYPKPMEANIITPNDQMIYKHVPSVSKVLNETLPASTKAELRKWKLHKKNVLGKNEFEKFYREQLKNDTQFHDCIRRHILGTPMNILKENADSRLQGSLHSLKGILSQLTNITVLESPVVHPDLPYHGIVDCVGCYNNNPVVLEWKQADERKSILDLTYDAPIQLSAYIGAINHDQYYKFPIKDGIVVIAYTDGSPADILPLCYKECLKYWEIWLERLNQYLVIKS